jgi:hypothetical protein
MIKCFFCFTEASLFYRYSVGGKVYATARCPAHTDWVKNFGEVSKEEYLAHKAMEAL